MTPAEAPAPAIRDVDVGTDADAAATRWFLGVRFALIGVVETARRIAARPPGAPFGYLSTPNAQHVVALGRGEARFARAHDGAWLVTNDSAILTLLARWGFGFVLPRAAGSDIVDALLADGIDPADPITIIGGSAAMEDAVRTRFGWSNVARHPPPMGVIDRPHEIERCVDFIEAHPARYVFLVMGAPQSELVALRAVERGRSVGTGLTVGSALDFSLGIVRRAPVLVRRLSLEWLYRLIQNPRRHWRRVFVASMPVLAIAARARLRADQQRAHRIRPA